jgi:NAD(P)-dependent dehydrogenase (short-subunit alcohol dehydrogenase family)
VGPTPAAPFELTGRVALVTGAGRATGIGMADVAPPRRDGGSGDGDRDDRPCDGAPGGGRRGGRLPRVPAASYVTGQCVVVDGGNSVAEERG